MFGKHFSSMYDGSMIGAGPVVFAVMGYVIAKAFNSRVELNPTLLGAVLGCSPKEVAVAIEKLCAPDKESRNPEHGGRRLVKEGSFQYFVVSWQAYRKIRNENDRREYNKLKQREYRAKKKGKPLNGEVAGCAALERGDTATYEHFVTPPDQRGEAI